MTKIPYALRLVPCLLLLSACTSYQNDFDCPPKPGIGCQSISEIHDQIQETTTGKDHLVVPETDDCDSGKCPNASRRPEVSLPPAHDGAYLVGAGGDLVRRIPERVIRVWVNGRVTETGDYEAAHYIYVALKDDGWAHVKASGGMGDAD